MDLWDNVRRIRFLKSLAYQKGGESIDKKGFT